jgi:hypothetical protein
MKPAGVGMFGGAGGSKGAAKSTRDATRHPFVPPKPKLFVRNVSIFALSTRERASAQCSSSIGFHPKSRSITKNPEA